MLVASMGDVSFIHRKVKSELSKISGKSHDTGIGILA